MKAWRSIAFVHINLTHLPDEPGRAGAGHLPIRRPRAHAAVEAAGAGAGVQLLLAG